jgi:type I restriction enzyme, S subunit
MKQTNVPDGWKEVKLGEIMIFKNGLNFSQDIDGIKVNFLGVGNFKDKNKISSLAEIDSIKLANIPNDDYLLHKNDLVFVRSNGSKDLVGRCVIINNDFEKLTYSGFCIRGRITSSAILPEYISALIEKGILKDKLKSENRGTNISNLNQDILNDLVISVPIIAEQKAIAETLSVWDNMIEKMEQLIARKEEVFNNLKRNILISKDTKPVLFSNLFKEISEKNISNSKYPVLSVTKDGVVFQEEYFNKRVASEDTRNYLIARKNTFVFSGLNFWMGSVDLQTITGIGLISPAYKIFEVNTQISDIRYIHHLIRSKYMIRILVESSVIGASIVRRNLDLDNLSNSIIKLPSLKEQKEIADILDNIQREINLLKQILNKYKFQKQGLMQKLLTGQWRIK